MNKSSNADIERLFSSIQRRKLMHDDFASKRKINTWRKLASKMPRAKNGDTWSHTRVDSMMIFVILRALVRSCCEPPWFPRNDEFQRESADGANREQPAAVLQLRM